MLKLKMQNLCSGRWGTEIQKMETREITPGFDLLARADLRVVFEELNLPDGGTDGGDDPEIF